MRLEWTIDAPVAPELLSLMQTAADCALLTEGVKRSCFVNVRLCDDDAIHEINRDYRGVDRATDVLSFPTVNYPAGVTAGQADRLIRRELDDELNACCLGDLIISVPHIYAQAEEYGHSPQREAAYLLVHGLCHLMGYDHMIDEDKRRMRSMEEKILSCVGITRDGENKVTDEMLLELARDAMTRSYSPYSNYPVGAALLCADGRIYQGCNIENASFGLSNCGERTAIFKAISEGAMEFTAIAIASVKSAPWPCGACRQVLNEFAPNIRVLVTWGDGLVDEAPLSVLLPHGFGPKDVRGEA
ncbi:MAG: cytidine deaminase [Clostridia bacterium]|nr:cytidine deaminase [Clostridia bacterium]